MIRIYQNIYWPGMHYSKKQIRTRKYNLITNKETSKTPTRNTKILYFSSHFLNSNNKWRCNTRPNKKVFLLVFTVTNIWNVGENSIFTTCSLKLKSSNVGVLIDSIFVIGGKLLFSTDSDNFFCSFFNNLLSLPYFSISHHSYWYQSIWSFLCSFIYIKHTPCSVYNPLCWHHIV